MPFNTFLFIVFFVYAIYYSALLILDIASAQKLSAATSQPNKNFVSAESFADETKEPVKVSAKGSYTNEAEKNKPSLPPVPDEATGMELETISYGMVVSAENIASMFVEAQLL